MNTLRTTAFSYVDRNSITWNELAQRSGIQPQTIYRFRAGQDMSSENTIKLALFLNLKLEDLK